METTLTTTDWYQAMIEDCDGCWTEGVFTARWTYIVMYHAIGKRILEEESNFLKAGISVPEAVQQVARSLGKGKRTVQYAVQFAREYKDINELPGGKNISWHKITNNLLAGKPLENEVCKHVEVEMVHVCKGCNCRVS